eukprot:Lithocolla_globosa_v1_NODE_173_length_5457_cov_128.572381.p5 type:complete len:100 gc:universal NODE_173_length_5457_cov_128.572381:328-627(+)
MHWPSTLREWTVSGQKALASTTLRQFGMHSGLSFSHWPVCRHSLITDWPEAESEQETKQESPMEVSFWVQFVTQTSLLSWINSFNKHTLGTQSISGGPG